ncbi:alpha-soluble NSF attachment protein 2 isoform X2 [Spinacia oleracea]|uniref:Alpha-soluble NSF attachment protein 2 isoform X2 n=1 Tax=Spinacia oleracea TaxID=3562 RepID=A0ABM3QPH0_SPIOL|nr:alpha-soluble NSF attachment protein 2-like isoform X2 [Spinacia oleracea]
MAPSPRPPTEGEECNNKADKMILLLFGSVSKHDDAVDFYQKSATEFKIAKSWDQAGPAYIKLAECHLKSGDSHEAAGAYVEAANCYKKISPLQAISCLEQGVNLFSNIGRFSMAARHCKEVGELYEQLRDFGEAIKYFGRAADFFQGEAATTSASHCKQKVALFFAQLKQYTKAIEVFEEVAQEAVNSNLLRYGVRGHLLNAGVCHLCKGDVVAVTNALSRYQNLDPTFSRTREYELLTDLVAAYEEQDVEKFTEVLMDYDSLSPLDSWKIVLLLRIKEDLKTKARI